MTLTRGIAVATALAALVLAWPQTTLHSDTRLADAPLTHVGIVVPDLDRASKTYADWLGVAVPAARTITDIRFAPDLPVDRSASLRVATFPMNSVTIELIEPRGGDSPWRRQLESAGAGLHHIAFGVASRKDHVRQLHSMGGTVQAGGDGTGAITSVDFSRQLGFAIELEDNAHPAAPPAYPAGSFASNQVVHVSAIVPDVEASGRVLADILGAKLPSTVVVKMGSLLYPKTAHGDLDAAPKHVTFKQPNILLELTEAQGGSSPWRDHLVKQGPSLHHLAFRVPGMADSIRYLEQKGGKVVLGGPSVTYAYVDMRPEPLGITIELNGPRQ